ncbi:MAG: hypothetical protein RLZZ46_1197 [Bacteroidota bacterium]|jgi:hypothetical protein
MTYAARGSLGKGAPRPVTKVMRQAKLVVQRGVPDASGRQNPRVQYTSRCSSVVEHFLGKEEVVSSILINGSRISEDDGDSSFAVCLKINKKETNL